MINFSSAFDSAWERMMVILFRPFDLGKWFVMGFSAFLAGLLSGGNGFNFSYNNPFSSTSGSNANSSWSFNSNNSLHSFNSSISNSLSGLQAGVIIGISIVVIVLVLALVVLMYWLGSRGQFMLLDNVVRNRGAVAWPWSRYAHEANGLFMAYLVFLGIGLAVILPFAVVGLIMAWPLIHTHSWPGGLEIAIFVLLFLVYLAIAFVLGMVFFIFREFGVPLMFRNGLSARAAFWESFRLMRLHPGTIALFVLLRIAIFVAIAVLSVIAICGTCCLGALPYLGTVVLLPTIIYVRCFSLDCLAQFGPEYNVWTVDVPPTDPAAAPLSPLPPLG